MKATDLLTEKALEMVETPLVAQSFHEEFQRLGVVQIDGFIHAEPLLDLGDRLWKALNPFAKTSSQKHEFVSEGRISGLSTGFRFQVADPSRFPEESRAELLEQYRKIGILEIGEELGQMLTPLIHYIIREDLPFKRVFCFLYREGDYISPHNDHQTGHRVNVQFPITMNAATGFRALETDYTLRLYNDNPGCLRILGPLVWHEVLPVIRTSPEVEPRRFLISLRYMN